MLAKDGDKELGQQKDVLNALSTSTKEVEGKLSQSKTSIHENAKKKAKSQENLQSKQEQSKIIIRRE